MGRSRSKQISPLEMSIHVTLAEYLRRLELQELDKPPALRRAVPTITQLSEAVGISRIAMSNIANDNMKLLNLKILSAVLSELRRWGFDTELTDILTAYPTELAKA